LLASKLFQVLRTNHKVPIVPANSNTKLLPPIRTDTKFGTGHGSKPRLTDPAYGLNDVGQVVGYAAAAAP
jgi:hypothetical protein